MVTLRASLLRAARAGRAAAREAGRRVEFEVAGGDARLDRSLAARVADPLLHLVRNAVGSGMRARPLIGLPPWVRMQVARSHEGDVIVEQRGRSRGLILWTGAAYTWTELPGGD